VPGLGERHRAVAEDRRHGGHRHDPGGGQRPAPAAHRDQQEHRHGQDQQLAGLLDGGRRAEHQRGHGGGSTTAGRHQQHREPGDDQGLEPYVGHDQVLDLQLVAVEQDRPGGQRGQPARRPAAQQQRTG
jgi:hypothetical protein